MADAKSAPQSAATTTEAAPGLLDQILTNTKQTEPDRAQELVKTLVEQALAGTVTFDRNLTRTFDKAVKAIDAKMSQQLNAIMHDPKFLKLEGSWRGLHYLVQNSETGTALKLRVLNMTKRELGRDLSRAIEFDQSQLFKKIYENEFGTPGVIARLPYGKNTKPLDEFDYEEAPVDARGKALAMDHESYCWSNAAYVMGARLTDAFAQTGFCTAIRGAEGGGKVENLPTHVFTSDDGDLDAKCPTEIGITDRREFELSNQGFLPLCHYKNTDYAAFFGAQTVQKPKKYDRPEATANAAISARLPYIMATGRIAHYLKVMGRDKIGSFMEASNVETWLNRWIQNYVNSNVDAGQDMKARFPLREARVEVKEIPGKPGSYNAIAYLRPWLQMEELTTSLRMVASIPQKA